MTQRKMKRTYVELVENHIQNYRQMVFLAGPRQVGKTTVGKSFAKQFSSFYYFNWDEQEDRQLIIKGPKAVGEIIGFDKMKKRPPLIVFDEIHKNRNWKQFLKGFFDLYGEECQIIVTGSAKLNVFKAGGDSLMGRYFLYRVHPLSVGELIRPTLPQKELHPPKPFLEKKLKDLLKYGGFPEPFLRKNTRFSHNWQRLRREQLIREDIRDLSQVQELPQLEVLFLLLQEQTGQLLSYTSLANAIHVSSPTIKRWLRCLESFYYCFRIHAWTKNVKRTLKKEPKYYLWDWSLIKDEGARKENFIACHLLKAVHLWTDRGLGEYGLFFVRDKEKREVDFLITKDGQPYFLVEVKSSNHGSLSKPLYEFHNHLKTKHAFQVVFDEPFIDQNCFRYKKPIIVPASTFLSQLP